MRKCFLAALVVVTFGVISEAYARPENYQLSEKEKTKLHEIGVQWKEVINWEKKPCNEFNDFVCTNKEHPKPEKRDAEDILKDMFKENPELVTEIEEKYLKFSSRCENIKQEEKIEFIKWFKFNSIGAWPAFEENWDDSKFNLPLAIGEMNSYNYPAVFKYFFNSHTNGSYDTYLTILEADLININENNNLFETAFKDLGVNNPEEVLADASLFEKTFNEGLKSAKSYNIIQMKYSELSIDFPQLELDKQIEIAYGKKFPDDYLVTLKSFEALQEIYVAISKLNPKVIANYFFCTFVFKTYDITSTNPNSLFKPVLRSSTMKNVYTENTKEIVKGMYITILEFLRDYFKVECSSEQIVKFVKEEIFGSTSEGNLVEDFKEVSTNENECMKNYNFLQKIQNKRLPKLSSNFKSPLLNDMKNRMLDLILNLANFVGEPSELIFERLVFAVIAGPAEYYNIFIGFTKEQKECISKQFIDEEITLKHLNTNLAVHFMLKIFSKWMKNYPEIVQQENKILEGYGLSSEKLHILSLAKYVCENESFRMISNAYANSVDFPQIFDCPVGSELNSAQKCTIW